MQTLLALFALARPLNGLITALSVAVGALTAGAPLAGPPLLKAALSALLINGAGNAFNDIRDIEIDRINRPGRPLPSGHLSPRWAQAFAAALGAGGSVVALWLGPLHFSFALAVGALLVLYSIFLKNSPLWGNILVSILGASAFPYGALALGASGRSWIPALFALLFHLGREIIKDIEDVEGDRRRGLHTLPLRWGRRRAALLAAAIYLLLLFFTFVPWALALYGLSYLLLVGAVDAVVLYVLYQLYRCRAALPHDRLGRLLKLAMLLGLAAIVAGEYGR